jgi:hypothetical protein
MAQLDVITKAGATYVGVESTFKTTPTMTRVHIEGGSVDIGLAVEELPVADERVRGFAHVPPVHGLESTSSTIKMSAGLRPHLTQLRGATPTVEATVPSLLQFLRGLWGKDLVSSDAGAYFVGQGSDVDGTASTTSLVNVSAGHGAARFCKGQWIAVQTGAATIEPAFITNIATDALSVWPNLSAAPTTAGWDIVNGYTFAPAQAHNASLTVQHAKSIGISGVSAAQWTANGCTGNLGLAWERGQIPKLTFELKAAAHTGPSDQSLTITAATDDMATNIALTSVTTLLQTQATTTRTNVPMMSIAVTFDGGMVQTPDYNAEQGVTGVIRIPARPFAKGTIRMRFDPTMDTSQWLSQTELRLVCIAASGSGLSQRLVGFDIPRLVIVGKPRVVDADGRLATEFDFESLEDSSVTSAASDLAFAPARLFVI